MRYISLTLQLVLCITIISCPRAVQAASYFVSPTGSDASSGSQDRPWATLQHATSRVQAGDIITVKAGRYGGFTVYGAPTGSPSAPISIIAEPGVIIDRPESKGLDGINIEAVSHWIVEGFTVERMPRNGIRTAVSQHVAIRNNVVRDNGITGIFTAFADDVVIEGNDCSGSIEQHGIYVSNSGDRPIIRNNVTWHNRGNGIQLNADVRRGGDGIISNALIENNLIFDNGKSVTDINEPRTNGAAINLLGAHDSKIIGNVLVNNHAGGIVLSKVDAAEGSKNNQILHNSVLMSEIGRNAVLINQGSTGNTFYNNILLTLNSKRSFHVTPDSLQGLTSDFNIVNDRFSANLDGSVVLSLAEWQAQYGHDHHSLVALPENVFVNASQNDLQLRSDSPARDAGIAMIGGKDIAGVERGAGIGTDIGAYEFKELIEPTPTPTPTATPTPTVKPKPRKRLRLELPTTIREGKQKRGLAILDAPAPEQSKVFFSSSGPNLRVSKQCTIRARKTACRFRVKARRGGTPSLERITARLGEITVRVELSIAPPAR